MKLGRASRTFSLRARLTLLLALAALIAIGIAAKVVDWRGDAEMQHRFDTSLLVRAQAFTALVRSGADGIEIDAVADRMARFPNGQLSDWYAVSCAGKLVAESHPPPPALAAGNAPRFGDGRLADGRRVRLVALRFRPGVDADNSGATTPAAVANHQCELRYALDRGPLETILHRLDLILIASTLGACVLVLFLTPWLVHRG
ncbi:MAG TPA: sensor histidine kinase N-terminal domain-containing protein, partial [Rhodanobacteraceae bacterium]